LHNVFELNLLHKRLTMYLWCKMMGFFVSCCISSMPLFYLLQIFKLLPNSAKNMHRLIILLQHSTSMNWIMVCSCLKQFKKIYNIVKHVQTTLKK
jgi:hypothetical protein